jgi:hypothetical protein
MKCTISRRVCQQAWSEPGPVVVMVGLLLATVSGSGLESSGG